MDHFVTLSPPCGKDCCSTKIFIRLTPDVQFTPSIFISHIFAFYLEISHTKHTHTHSVTNFVCKLPHRNEPQHFTRFFEFHYDAKTHPRLILQHTNWKLNQLMSISELLAPLNGQITLKNTRQQYSKIPLSSVLPGKFKMLYEMLHNYTFFSVRSIIENE